jgi:predicted aspartyl protease
MSERFEPRHGLIEIRVKLWGPRGEGVLRFAVDTGATDTLVGTAPLVTLGYDPTQSSDRVRVTTGSGVEFVPRIVLDKIHALGQERTWFPVLCHTRPPSANVDGLLGLDFLRGQALTIDFPDGQIGFR